MSNSNEVHKKIGLLFILIVLSVLAFFILRPFMIAALGGLLLAYIFYPVYSRIAKRIKNKTLAASIVVLLVAVIAIIPLRFLIPLLIRQIFEIFTYSQSLDMGAIVQAIFPSASKEFLVQMVVTFNSVLSSGASYLLNLLSSFVINIPNLAVKLLICGIVFFFAMRDQEKFKQFVDEISPLSKSSERVVVNHFKGLTNSIIFGNIIVGVIQGILAGIGLFVFGIPNAFVLTILAVVFAIIPFIGPAILWIPITIYLFAQGQPGAAVAYLLYNIFIVSTMDNILRAYIVSRHTKISQILVFVGMIGGVLAFGFLGLILGPLVLAYFQMFIELYRSNKLYSALSD